MDYGPDESQWKSFLAEVEKKGNSGESCEGFLLAVISCIQSEGEQYDVPKFVTEGIRYSMDSVQVPV